MYFPPNVIIHVGDRAVFIDNAGMLPQYGITKGQPYEGIITKSTVGCTEIEITNDFGDKETHEGLYGSFDGGMTTVKTLVDGEPLRLRKLAYVDQLITRAEAAHLVTMAELQVKRNIILQE